MREITTDTSPSYDLPFSQAVESNGFIYVSGQVPVDPDSGEVVSEDIREQTSQALENAATILEGGGASLEDAVKVTLYIVDIDDFAEVNEAYAESLSPPYPARSAVEVSDLAIDAGIEIDVVAEVDGDGTE